MIKSISLIFGIEIGNQFIRRIILISLLNNNNSIFNLKYIKMKKFILMSFVFLMSLSTAMAQEKQEKQLEDSNYVILLNDKVFHYTFEGVKPLTGTLTLKNGTVVKEDGTYIVDDKKMTLKDGECLGLSGKKYKSQMDLAKRLKKKMRKK